MIRLSVVIAPSIFPNRAAGGTISTQTTDLVFSFDNLGMFRYRVKAIMSCNRIVGSNK